MKTIAMKTASRPAPAPLCQSPVVVSTRKHGAQARRPSTWKILSSTVAGLPAFLWHLEK